MYLRDAGVGKIQKAAKQRLSVIGADGGSRVGKQVVVKHALPEKLVKKPGGVGRAQGASEPGMLDGDIHTGVLLAAADVPGLLWCRKGSDVGSVKEPERGTSPESFRLPRDQLFLYARAPKERL